MLSFLTHHLCIDVTNTADTESTFSELLQKDCAVTIHTKNLQILMTEMYKTKNELDPSFMQEIFRKIQLATICEIITTLLSPE